MTTQPPKRRSVLIIEDETDSCMVYISPDSYPRWNASIWGSEGGYIAVKGKKAAGLQMIHAENIVFGVLEPEAELESYTE